MIRLRVSTLEAFRRVVQEDFGDEEALRQTIVRGQWADGPSNWKMDAGTEWHRLLASQQPQVVRHGTDGRTASPYRFDGRAVLDARKLAGPGLHEVAAARCFDWRGRCVNVRGQADHVRGLLVQDHKTKFSAPDPRDYEPSLQWRFYLACHEARCFRYNLFAFKDPKDGFCDLRDVVSFNLWAYPGLESECRDWVRRLLEWAADNDLLRCMEP